jgi:general nucleoside transport system ATP-binding protein
VDAPTVLELRGITKRFPGIVADDHVDFDLQRGEVHALLGENGAGKSTLMNMLYGLYKPDEGEIVVGGKAVTFGSAKDAIASGIGMVHQHFMLIPVMTVAENIVLGTEPTTAGVLLDDDEAVERVRKISSDFGFAVDPEARVENISVGQEQRVEILKALYRGADILILDEPTAVLTPQEATELFGIINSLKAEGKSIIFISHKLNEVLEVADRITVLRRGKKIDTVPRAGATEDSLAKMMVGREVLLRVQKTAAEPGDVALRVEDLHVQDDRGLPAVRGVSFDVRAGEIVGIAGVSGNGQRQLVEVLAGQREAESGDMRVAGDSYHASREEMRRHKMSLLPEEPLKNACVGGMSVADNIAFREFDRAPFASLGWWLNRGAFRDDAKKKIGQYKIKTRTPDTPISALSGGNVQRAVLARELGGDVEVLIAANPCFGLDFAAVAQIHAEIMAARNRGAAVLLVSEDLDELLELSDRLVVMFHGEFVYEARTSEADLTVVGRHMAGH